MKTNMASTDLIHEIYLTLFPAQTAKQGLQGENIHSKIHSPSSYSG